MEELAAIFRRARGNREPESRAALFESLRDLERRARCSGMPESILRRVAESRFLAGVLREAVSPIRYQSVRGTRHLWTAAPDLQASREAILQG
ncbi:hypothetical protein [Methylobacterium persicinum]|nr:hypothetical protein [Methylobacterium persicinum]